MITNIDEMPAGDELDQLVIEKVVGRKYDLDEFNLYGCGNWYGVRSDNNVAELLHADFSSDMSKAWRLIERKLLKTQSAEIIKESDCDDTDLDPNKAYLCVISWFDKPKQVEAYGRTAPLAICRAMLKAVESDGK